MRGARALTAETAVRFSRIALGHVRREYPNKPGHVLAGPEDARTPAALHPVFFGSYDWHSCVHAYWMLAHLLRRFPGMETAAEIRALFDTQLTPEKVAGECAYLAAPVARGFERPYGWGWLLKLSAALRGLAEPRWAEPRWAEPRWAEPRWAEPRWAEALQPLADVFVRRFRDFLPLATYPVRSGAHFNTAFALRLAADYAEAAGDGALTALLTETALGWYGGDEDCPAWGEPSGDDFLSPALIEAECMRRLLPAADFRPWFDRFLPRLAEKRPATLFEPARVSDRSDGKIAHLDGLNLSRAWCWRALAGALAASDARAPLMREAAGRHLAASLAQVAGDYMGEHWLASFATLALDPTHDPAHDPG